MAKPYANLGRTKEGLSALTEAMAAVQERGERWWEAEVHRIKGELLLLSLSPQIDADAEACFRQALEVARQQTAKSLELRAATSLARLWQRRGKIAEARDLLAPVYGWFSEGFDTADLKEAKALLNDLA